RLFHDFPLSRPAFPSGSEDPVARGPGRWRVSLMSSFHEHAGTDVLPLSCPQTEYVQAARQRAGIEGPTVRAGGKAAIGQHRHLAAAAIVNRKPHTTRPLQR